MTFALFALISIAAIAVTGLLAVLSTRKAARVGRRLPGRYKVRDVGTAIQFRMGSFFAGEVTRPNFAVIEPNTVDGTTPPTLTGQAVLMNTNGTGVRALATSDPGTSIYGVTVRSYPVQQQTGGLNAAFGQGSLNTPEIDVLKKGYIAVPVVGTPKKGGIVYVWIAAASGQHIVGGFEAANTAGSTAILAGATWGSTVDTNGNAELNLGY